jgi:hypothetical protein
MQTATAELAVKRGGLEQALFELLAWEDAGQDDGRVVILRL